MIVATTYAGQRLVVKDMISGFWAKYCVYPIAERALGRDVRRKLKDIQAFNALPLNEKLKLQRKSLVETVKEAGLHVPYYRDLFKSIHFEPEKLEGDAKFILDLPFLTKEILREQGSRMISDRYSQDQLVPTRTGGSTGPVLTVYYSKDEVDWTAAVNLYVHSLTGRSLLNREVHLSTRFPENFSFKSRLKERMKCIAMNRTNITTAALEKPDLEALFEKICSIQPYLLQGYPSTMRALAQFISSDESQQKRAYHAFKVFESTGETIDPETYRLLTKTFGCRVFNRYGNAEFGVIAHSLDDALQLKIIANSVFAENFIYGAGLPEIVVTTLRNRAMPLLRYRTGDLGEVVVKDGEAWIEQGVRGRIHDIVSVNGAQFPSHYFRDLLSRVGGVDEFQIVADTDKKVAREVRIVMDGSAQQPVLMEHLKKIFGSDIEITFCKMSELTRSGWRDKFRHIICSDKIEIQANGNSLTN